MKPAWIATVSACLLSAGCLPMHGASRFEHPEDEDWEVLERVGLDQAAPMGSLYQVKPPAEEYEAVRLRAFLREVEVSLFSVWVSGGKEFGKGRPISLVEEEARTFKLPEPGPILRIDIQARAHGHGKGGGVLLVLGKRAGP